MSNMSYCRFENTAKDLEDCSEHINDDLSDSDYERRARKRLVALCRQIADDYNMEDEDNAEN